MKDIVTRAKLAAWGLLETMEDIVVTAVVIAGSALVLSWLGDWMRSVM